MLYVSTYLDGLDPDLLPPRDWNRFAIRLSHLVSFAESFKAHRSAGYIYNAGQCLDEILREDVIFRPMAANKRTAKSFNATLSQLLEDVSKQLQTLGGQKTSVISLAEGLKSKFDELERRYASVEQQIAAQIQQHQNQFSQAQESRQNEYSAAQNTRQERFLTAEEDRTKEFSSVVTDLKYRASEVKAELKLAFDEMQKRLTEESESLILQMKETQRKTETIYGLVGKESVVGAQKHYADRARIMAHCLFGIAVTLMTFVAVLVVWPLLRNIGDAEFFNVDWASLAFRIPVVAVMLLPAGYLANEAKKQRKKEDFYRELEVKLSAVAPYFESISANDRSSIPEKERVMIELAREMLTPARQKDDQNVIVPPEVLEIIKAVANGCKVHG